MNYIDLTPVVLAIIALIAAIVARKLIPFIEDKWFKNVVKMLVFAAEQLYGACNGSKKLEYVISELKKRGFTADRAAIEAAVWEHLNKDKKDKTAEE